MVRLCVDCLLDTGAEIVLPTEAAHHARSVLRLSRDDTVELFDGRGNVYEANLTLVSRGEVRARIGAPLEYQTESPLEITLVQSVSRGERMDYTLQKAVELGVTAVVPVISQRTVVKLDRARADKRLEHWRGVIRHAAEQSRRRVLPEIHALRTLDAWMADTRRAPCFLLHPGASQALASQSAPGRSLYLLAGPEGGFDPTERERLVTAGAIPVTLGPRTLRTETAAVAALAVMQALWGDFR